MVRYKYTLLLVAMFVLASVVGYLGYFDSFITPLIKANTLLYTFIAGAMYSFSFTAPFAVLLFSNLDIPRESLFIFCATAALGGLIIDLLIFRFIKDVILEELGKHTQKVIKRATRRNITKVLLGFIGAIIVASPFPDEIGLTFMGLSKISFLRLVVLTFFLDMLGAYILFSTVAQIQYAL